MRKIDPDNFRRATRAIVWAQRATEIGETQARLAAARSACRDLDLRPAFAAALRPGAAPLTTDGVHLTEAGAEVVAQAFAAAITRSDTEVAT